MYVTDETLAEALLNMHTAFIGKVISVSGKLATVQPLNMMKQFGGEAKKRSVVSDVPILSTVKKIQLYETDGHGGHVRLSSVSAGDIVLCVCADRDISQTRKGNFATPSLGHHEIKDAVIVGVI